MKNCWKLKSNNYFFALFFLLLTTAATSPIEFEKYKGYYIFPISPGQRSYLSGNFCELRGSHFHAGVDVKIGGVVGAPIHAAADGYVSRIKVSTGGYGNALYIQHPNGTTSVYAHLLEYNEEMADYVRKAQYANKKFEVELFPGEGTFSVKQGEIIGKAGNSGSSGGPHLHFEIRDRNQFPLDPLKFGFSEVVDTTPPDVRRIALITLDKNARVNGQFGRFEFDVVSQGKNYTVREPITVHGLVGIEISAFDRADGVRNMNGVSATDMSIDGKLYFNQEMNRFSFDEARNIFVHTNYEIKQKHNRTFYKLYVDDGNTLDFYKTNETAGKINITDTESHALLINVYDTYGNQSVVNTTLQGKQPEGQIRVPQFSKPDNDKNYYISRNTLQLFVPVDKSPEGLVQRKIVSFYANRRGYDQSPDYLVNDMAVYLWDLKKGLPDSVNVCNGIEKLSISMAVEAGNAYDFYQPAMHIHFPKNALYDTAYLFTAYNHSGNQEIFTLHENTIPLRSYLTVAMKPLNTYSDKEKTSVYAIADDGEFAYMGGSWNGEEITFRTRDFGRYTIITDAEAPSIRPASVSTEQLRFTIKDKLSGIRDFDAYVNGKWVLMHYDYKRDLIWSEKQDNNKPFAGELKLVVTDNAGNREVYTSSIGG
jgi:hypothetical protein